MLVSPDGWFPSENVRPHPGKQTADPKRLQPRQRLLVFTPLESVQRQMALIWGAEAHLVWTVQTTDEMVRQVDSALVSRSVCRPNDLVIVVAGTPPSTPGSTNTIRVHHIGDVLRHG